MAPLFPRMCLEVTTRLPRARTQTQREMNLVRIIASLLLILAMGVLIIGCDDDATPTPSPTSTASPTATPAPAATATPVPTATPETPPTPAPTATPTAAPVIPPTPTTKATDPTDAYFALDRVLDIRIEIDPEDWDVLRHQTRTREDLNAEIEKHRLSQPFAKIYDWFSGTVTVDGETLTEVGVRKKGFLGSQSDTKPSLKLRFDKYVEGQSLGGAMERMTLNNSVQDVSMLNTCLSYRIFAAAGSPAPRCNFATVSVNGEDLGLYVHVEEIKRPFLARHFDSDEGNLYEGTISDFAPGYRGTFEKKTNEDTDDWSDIDAVVAALRDPSDAGLEALSELVDLDRFLSYWAAETLVGHWDGYAVAINNYHFYREPGGAFVFIPWGVDDTFELLDGDAAGPLPVMAVASIPNRLYNDLDWRKRYAARLSETLEAAWDEDELLAFVDEMAVIVQRHALPEARSEAAADAGRVRKFILERKDYILAGVALDPSDWPDAGGGFPAPPDPSDAYFALDRVLDISIEIDPEDWDRLRHQTRTLGDLAAELKKYRLSQPFADIYDWFSGTVIVDGETHTKVGVRKKGFLGSQSDMKPSLKLHFDRHVEGQTLGGAMTRMTLNNSVQDPSMLNTCMSYYIFAAAGNPSPRCNFATVSVNGENLGLYVHVEEIKPPFLARHFDSDEGNLYEGTASDFTPEYRGTFEKKTNEDADDWSDIDALVAAMQDPSDAGLEALGVLVDLDRFLSYWAAEFLVDHSDGYAAAVNNYYLYREPDGPFVFIPWGADDTFHVLDDSGAPGDDPNPPPVVAVASIPDRLYNHPGWRKRYAVRLGETLDSAWDEEVLLALVDGMAAIVQQHALPEARPEAADGAERIREFIMKRKAEVLAALATEPSDWPDPPEGHETLKDLLNALAHLPVGVETAPVDVGLVINEVAANGDPMDWFELYNSSTEPIALSDFVLADDLTDDSRRVAFPADAVLLPGQYLQFRVDKDGWPGFALGSDEELGIWLADGTLVASVDWDDGQSGEGQSYARVPDVTGEFRTVDVPTPGRRQR